MVPGAEMLSTSGGSSVAAPPSGLRFRVNSPNVQYTSDRIVSRFMYEDTSCEVTPSGEVVVTPSTTQYTFTTSTAVPRMGLMLVGLGGNNGTTVAASILANREKMAWRTKAGLQQPNYFGSLTQASTVRLGKDPKGDNISIPFKDILPMVNPNDIVVGGWDISDANLAVAMERAQVLEPDLQRQVAPKLSAIVPLPSIYYPDFIAANQSERANNVMRGSKQDNLEQVRKDIRDFRAANQLDSVVVLWTANTERYADIVEGVNDSADNLLAAIKAGHSEVSPSTVFAVACILEGVPFINGSPQNTFVPGCVELAERHRSIIAGDDFKSGQTKLKSVLVDFLVSAGIKPLSITSYNHLGNNDGKNLSAPSQFRSKEISKSNVVDDMVASNDVLYKTGEHPDHVVVIKYVPAVGDSKRAMDEYYNEIFMGGRNTIAIHNVCEDSLLAAPLLLDLAIITELFSRIRFTKGESKDAEPQPFHPVLSALSYLLKAPLVPRGQNVVNSLFRQRQALENILRACVGLPPQNDMLLEERAF